MMAWANGDREGLQNVLYYSNPEVSFLHCSITKLRHYYTNVPARAWSATLEQQQSQASDCGEA
jgi:hypothetical protein